MFTPTSRYYNLETTTYEDSEVNKITYLRRRFLPPGEKLFLLVEATVTDGDRLDLIVARKIGNAEAFWRVCDANNAMNPFDLLDEPGNRVRVPVPQVNS